MPGRKKAAAQIDSSEETMVSHQDFEGIDPFTFYDQQMAETPAKEDDELLKVISAKLKEDDAYSAILSLGAYSLLPENLSMEMRFAQLIQYIVPLTTSDQVHSLTDVSALAKAFDIRYAGRHQMLEVDTQQSLYISWIPFSENTYKAFTGAIEEGELYHTETNRRLGIIQHIDPNVEKIIPTIEWFASKTDAFIRSNQLDVSESRSGKDYQSDIMSVKSNINSLKESYDETFVIQKGTLDKDVLSSLQAISLKPDEFKQVRLEPPQLYSKPLIDYGEFFFAPMPQLVIPALHEYGFDLFAKKASLNEEVNKYEAKLYKQALEVLENHYGPKKVMEKLRVNGEHWADFCVLFDGKLIFINLAVADASNIQGTLRFVEDTFKTARDTFVTDSSATVTSTQGPPESFREIYDGTDHIVLTLFDSLSYDTIVTSKGLDDVTIYSILPFSSWKFILDQSKNPMEFIRYLRSQEDLHRRNIKRIGITTLDTYIDYRDGNHQLRDIEKDPDVLMIDMTGGSRLVSEYVSNQRKNARIIDAGGRRVVAHQNWKNFFGYSTDGVLKLMLQDARMSCEFNIELPDGSTSKELAHSSYIVFDSLCYFIDENIEKLEILPELNDTVVINVTINESIEELHIKGRKEERLVTVDIVVGPAAYKRFIDQNNSGERWIVHEFAKAIGIKDTQAWVDEVKPLSTERNFQTKTFAVGHKSYEQRPNPIEIGESEEWWVDEVIASAVLKAGMKPGIYKDSREIGRLAPKLMDVAKKALREKLQEYSPIHVITKAYEQLEMAYVANEHDHLSILANKEIRDLSSEDQQELSQKEQKFTSLTFANRFLLELALQSSGGGNKFLSDEAYLELISLADRVVNMDFLGDTIYLGLQPGTIYISKRGYPGLESQSDGGKILAQKHLDSAISTSGFRAGALAQNLKPTEPPERVRALAEPFKETYGYTIEEWLSVVKSIMDFINGLRSPVVSIPRRVLVGKLASLSGETTNVVERAINEMTLSHEILQDVNINPSERFWREERIINKPLVLLTGSQLLCFSRAVVERYAMSYFERLTSGRLDLIKNNPDLPLSKMIMQQVNEDATEFEKEVDDLMLSRGLRTRLNAKSVGGLSCEETAGEIDDLVWDEANNRIIVIEAKNNTPSRSPIEIKTEMDNYFGKGDEVGYFDKLEKKFNWIVEHPDQVREQFSIPEDTKYSVEGILITKSILASAELRKPKFKTMKLSDFDDEYSKM